MSNPTVDTDVLIRLLTGDDPRKQTDARALFEAVEAGTITLDAPDTVIADAVFVLGSPRIYALPRAQVAAMLTRLMRIPSFKVANRRTVLRALDVYATTNLDFGDAMIVAAMQRTKAQIVYSYDRDFDRIAGITRREPPALR